MNPMRCLTTLALLVLLVDVCPAGAGKVLTPGEIPLTQAMVDLDHAVLEMLFDLSFTDVQKAESQRLLVAEWKSMTPAKRREIAANLATWEELAHYRNYERNLQRACKQTRLLELLRKLESSQRARYLVKLFDAAFTPGSARNPILVDAEPPLTQLLVDRYRDYLEPILNLSLSGGFTSEQQKTLREYLVEAWKKMPVESRRELLADVDAWSKAAAPGKPADIQTAIATLRPKLLSRVTSAADEPLHRWLLELAAQEQKSYELMTFAQRRLHETRRFVPGAIAPDGSWRYNPARGSYEWAPR